jgi:actin, other eukaryote
MDHDFNEAIVVDIGSHTTRAGLSGHDYPKVIEETVVGRPRLAGAVTLDHKDLYIGREAIEKRDILELSRPVKYSIVQNWEEVDKIYHHIFFNQLMADSNQSKILVIEPPLNKRAYREKVTEVMFETFNCSGFYLANSSVMSLFATGRTTGIVIESGLNETNVVPIYEGYALPQATLKLPIGGEEITNFLITNLKNSGIDLPYSKEFEVAQELKEKHCYMSTDYQQELNSVGLNPGIHKECELPDGSKIMLSVERFKSPEILFQPLLVGVDQAGIHELAYNAAQKCDGDIRRQLFANIIISGGNTIFPKIKEKLMRDIKSLAPNNYDIIVKAPPERKHLSWIGGAILSSLEKFRMWVGRSDYDEFGTAVVHRRCF